MILWSPEFMVRAFEAMPRTFPMIPGGSNFIPRGWKMMRSRTKGHRRGLELRP